MLKTSTVGARAADIRAKLADIDRSQLPGVEEARAQQELRQTSSAGSTGTTAQDPARIVTPTDDDGTRAAAFASHYLKGSTQAQRPTPAGDPPPQVTEVQDNEKLLQKHPVEKAFGIFESVTGGIVDMFSGHLNDGQGVEPYRVDTVAQTAEARALEEKQLADAQLAAEKQAAEKQADELKLGEAKQAEQQTPTADQGLTRQAEALARQQQMSEAITAAAQSDTPDEGISDAEYYRQIRENDLRQDRSLRR